MHCILTVNFSPWSRYSGGGQRSTHNLATALARRGHRVDVVFTKPPWEDVAVPRELPYGVVWAALPALRSRSGAWLRPASAWFVAREVGRLVAGASTAIVHGNGEEAAAIGGLRRRGARFGFVVTPRYPALPAPIARGWSRRSGLWSAILSVPFARYVQLGRALRSADYVCPTSRATLEMIERAYLLPSARAAIIPNGVSAEFVAALPAERESAEPYAVYFGRLAREKGVHVILDALASLRDSAPRLVFAGRGPEARRLWRRVQELGLAHRVRFEPWLEPAQLAALVRRASFAVLPSLEESFGNTMAEAMTLGVPVISTRVGSIPELIEHERTGLLVAPGDVAALAAAMRRLWEAPARRRELGEAARQHALAEWSWDKTAARFEAVYAELV